MPGDRQASPTRRGDDLSHLTVESMLPIDPLTMARELPPAKIRDRLMGQNAFVAGLRHQGRELRAAVALNDAALDTAIAQQMRMIQALHLAEDDDS